MPVTHKAHIFILIHINVTDIGFTVLIIGVVGTGIAAAGNLIVVCFRAFHEPIITQQPEFCNIMSAGCSVLVILTRGFGVEGINIILVMSFIFFIGSSIGWVLEVFYRRFFSDANPERKWINPGFLQGPYLPLYGISLLTLYLLALIPMDFIDNKILRRIVLFIIMAAVITVVEYIAGLIFIKGMKIMLWDYSNDWGNIQGIICPKYTFYWMLLSAIYYFLIHGKVIDSIYWLSEHLAFSFFVGFFYGVFFIDFSVSLKISARISKFARENQILVRYEDFKQKIVRKNEALKLRAHFFLQIRPFERSFGEVLKDYAGAVTGSVTAVGGAIGHTLLNAGHTIRNTIVPGDREKKSVYEKDVDKLENEK